MTKRKTPWHRPSSDEVDRSIFTTRNKRHYSQDINRKLELGRRAVERGDDPHDVCCRLFGAQKDSFIELLKMPPNRDVNGG